MHRNIAFAFHFYYCNRGISGASLGSLGGLRALQHAIHGRKKGDRRIDYGPYQATAAESAGSLCITVAHQHATVVEGTLIWPIIGRLFQYTNLGNF